MGRRGKEENLETSDFFFTCCCRCLPYTKAELPPSRSHLPPSPVRSAARLPLSFAPETQGTAPTSARLPTLLGFPLPPPQQPRRAQQLPVTSPGRTQHLPPVFSASFPLPQQPPASSADERSSRAASLSRSRRTQRYPPVFSVPASGSPTPPARPPLMSTATSQPLVFARPPQQPRSSAARLPALDLRSHLRSAAAQPERSSSTSALAQPTTPASGSLSRLRLPLPLALHSTAQVPPQQRNLTSAAAFSGSSTRLPSQLRQGTP